MKVGFYLVKDNMLYYRLATILAKSVHNVMPGVPVVQFTDEKSPVLVDADEVIRRPSQPLNLMRCGHFMSVEGDWVFVDSDVYFQKDVRHVFDKPFDIALTDRNWPHITGGGFSLDGMQSNVGVVFSRSPQFWNEVKEWFDRNPEYIHDWYGDQRAICRVSERSHWLVRALPGFVYNYPPGGTTDPATSAAIVHCKGNRKEWMLSREFQCV